MDAFGVEVKHLETLFVVIVKHQMHDKISLQIERMGIIECLSGL